jgi:prepilin-type processing-associated H-X9-DG protein
MVMQIRMVDIPVYTGIVWHYYDDKGFAGAPPPPAKHKINGPYSGELDDIQLRHELRDFAAHCKPSSRHPGGANAVMLDGSVRFIGDHISYRVFQALMTPHGKRSHVPFREFVLQDNDWQ